MQRELPNGPWVEHGIASTALPHCELAYLPSQQCYRCRMGRWRWREWMAVESWC